MKKLGLLTMVIAMLFATATAMAGVQSKNTMPDITYPNVGTSNTNYCRIASITYGSTITMVKLVYNTAKVTFEDTKDISIVDQANNKTYDLKFIKGLKSGEEVELEGKRFVTLVFPKLKKNPQTVNIVWNGGNDFQFLNVDLTQSGPIQSVFDKDALETELNKQFENEGIKFKQLDD